MDATNLIFSEELRNQWSYYLRRSAATDYMKNVRENILMGRVQEVRVTNRKDVHKSTESGIVSEAISTSYLNGPADLLYSEDVQVALTVDDHDDKCRVKKAENIDLPYYSVNWNLDADEFEPKHVFPSAELVPIVDPIPPSGLDAVDHSINELRDDIRKTFDMLQIRVAELERQTDALKQQMIDLWNDLHALKNKVYFLCAGKLLEIQKAGRGWDTVPENVRDYVQCDYYFYSGLGDVTTYPSEDENDFGNFIWDVD